MKKKKEKQGKENLHKDLKGFEIQLNAFGQIETSMNIENLNEFLNKNLQDKKLDQPEQKAEEEE
jgi:hypothetical protein